MLPKLKNHTDDYLDGRITSTQASWISSLLTAGAAIGSFVFGYLVDAIGRRRAVLSLAVPSLLGYILLCTVRKVEALYFIRFIIGMSVGGALTIIPLYVTEIPGKSIRGVVSLMVTSSGGLGGVLIYAIGPYVKILTFNMILLTPPIIFAVSFFFFGEETAHYHVKCGNIDEARKTLEKIRSENDDIDDELKEIIKKCEEQEGSIKDSLLSKPTLKAFAIAIGLVLFQQLTGMECVQFYSQEIFKLTGSSLKPAICSIITGVTHFVAHFSVSLIAEKFNRKTLLYVSAIGITLVEVPLGIFCYLQDHGHNVESFKLMPVICLVLFVIFYNLGMGPLAFTIAAEIFPARCKHTAISITIFFRWVVIFFLTKFFRDIVDGLGIGACFLMFSGFACCSILFIKFVVIETRGKTLEQIRDRFNK